MIEMRGQWVKASVGICLLVELSLMSVGPAESGQFYEKNGVMIDRCDPVASFEDNRAVKGYPSLSHAYKSSTILFASLVHRAAFVQASDRFVPQFGGFCAYGIAEWIKAKSEGAVWEIVDGKLDLNYNAQIQSKWMNAKERFIREAEAKWSSVEASTTVYTEPL